MIAAISAQAFDNFPGATSNPNDNPICFRPVTAQCMYSRLYSYVCVLTRETTQLAATRSRSPSWIVALAARQAQISISRRRRSKCWHPSPWVGLISHGNGLNLRNSEGTKSVYAPSRSSEMKLQSKEYGSLFLLFALIDIES